jgi:hypothetical protein
LRRESPLLRIRAHRAAVYAAAAAIEKWYSRE